MGRQKGRAARRGASRARCPLEVGPPRWRVNAFAAVGRGPSSRFTEVMRRRLSSCTLREVFENCTSGSNLAGSFPEGLVGDAYMCYLSLAMPLPAQLGLLRTRQGLCLLNVTIPDALLPLRAMRSSASGGP
ncbi:hypothetical protein OH77DRAFT_8152 [Trametes cingulata]|nr:hypothetical protein OH77DRAFT_8152 [Trametes cingulata]